MKSLVVEGVTTHWPGKIVPDARAEVHLVRGTAEIDVRAWRGHAAGVGQVFRPP